MNLFNYGKFEDFLRSVHAKQYTGTDDDMPDDYDEWVSEIAQYKLVVYANMWKEELLRDIQLVITKHETRN